MSQAFSGQFDAFRLPTVDLTQPVIGYFEYLQRVVDVNRDVAIRWAGLVTDFAGSMREQAQQQAREAYEGLTKVGTVRPVGRAWPTQPGNVEDLIERLVNADTE